MAGYPVISPEVPQLAGVLPRWPLRDSRTLSGALFKTLIFWVALGRPDI
jgi:hypothetical protein